jgi:hypothetical protein
VEVGVLAVMAAVTINPSRADLGERSLLVGLGGRRRTCKSSNA